MVKVVGDKPKRIADKHEQVKDLGTEQHPEGSVQEIGKEHHEREEHPVDIPACGRIRRRL